MGERTARNEIGTGRRKLWNPLQRHASGDFCLRTVLGPSHCLVNHLRRHVVEQEHLYTGVERSIDLFERGDFYFHGSRGAERSDLLYGVGDTTCNANVIVLDENAVIESHAMVGTAADSHRIF